MIVAMVVPALGSQFLHEVLDHDLPQSSLGLRIKGIRCTAYDIIKMSYEVSQRRGDAAPRQRVTLPWRRRLFGNAPARSDRAAAPGDAQPIPCRVRRRAIARSATRRTRRCGSRAGEPPAAGA